MQRFWELDALRGIAIIMMVASNSLLDLDYFWGAGISLGSGPWFWFARITASIFIFLAGASLSISNSRSRGLPESERAKKFVWRGTKIFLLGMTITAVTWALFPSEFIVFGILHFIGISIAISPLFLRLGKWNLAAGLGIIIAGIALAPLRFGFNWLLWLGLAPAGFRSFDYFPLLPWLGIMLIGIFAGSALYPNAKRIFWLAENSGFVARKLCWLGRHSLKIYFLHQPFIVGAILLLRAIA